MRARPVAGHNARVRTSPVGFRAYAHRGGAREAPENSLAAFRNASSVGICFLETDVRPTRDGVAVLMHDARLDRTTDSRGPVHDLTWDRVRRTRLVDGSAPLRLEELLEEFPDAHVTVDAKEDGSVTAIADAVRRAQAVSRVCIASFSRQRLGRLRALLPDAESGAHPWEVARLRFWPPRSLPRVTRVQVPPTALGMPVAGDGLLSRARARGLAVDVWTIDAPHEMAALLDLGVDGIMTDSPSVLMDVLAHR